MAPARAGNRKLLCRLLYIIGKRQEAHRQRERKRRMMMKEKLEQIKAEALRQIASSDALDKLNEVRVNYLGKKGELTAVLKGMKDVAAEERPKVGQLVNETREEIERVLEETVRKMEKAVREAKMKQEVIDVTLPARKNNVGHRHPSTIALEEVERIFIGMGYEVVEGPEVEKDYYNFEALNIPADHPAKDEQDTFYITGDILLRTQTSSTQVHEMEKGHLHDRARPCIPFRRSGRYALPVFPPDRRSGDRQEYHAGGSERDAGGICQRAVRGRDEGQIQTASFPVHRAECGD